MSGAEKKTRGVLFDLDDTLFDHHHSSWSGICAVRSLYPGLQAVTAEELLAEHVRLLEETHVRVMRRELMPEAARVLRMQGLFAYCRAGAAASDIEAAIAAYRAAYHAARGPVSGAADLLRALRSLGIKTAVVSNNILAEQREKLVLCRLDSLVDALVVSEEVGISKPDPHIFDAALARIGCDAERAAMIGDSWPADVIGARNAGIDQILWLNRFGASCPNPEWVRCIYALEPAGPVLAMLR